MPVGRIDPFLSQTLDSINQQTFRDFELVVVCGADILDDVTALLRQMDFDFPTQIIATRLRGVAFAANLGIAHARADLIARWDSDDLCDPQRFARQVEELDKDPTLGVIGTRVVIVDEAGQPNRFQKFKFFQTDSAIRRALKYRQPLLHSALVFRAALLFGNKGYLYGHTSEDHEMFIRIARNQNVKFMNLPDVVTYYRRHSSQLSDLSNQHNAFYEIAGFMTTEFLRTWNPLYVFGIVVNLPVLRRLRHRLRALRRAVSGANPTA
jgi:glycosyltransferase involved in cell wall biosynthesis